MGSGAEIGKQWNFGSNSTIIVGMKKVWDTAVKYLSSHKIIPKKVGVALAIFLLGWLANYIYCTHIEEHELPVSIRQNSSEFKYINPLLFVDNSKEDFSEYKPLEKDMREYIDHAVSNNRATKVSVYFRDLNTSRWGGINERELYAPSSMLKVAVLMSYLRIAEKDPEILDKKVWYKKSDRYGENYKPAHELSDGYHTIRELLQYMIVDSDNSSMSTLVALRSKDIANIYKDLRLPDLLEGPDDFMSAESYSYLFRTLYNATYLRRTYSEEALKLLTHTTFDKGIMQGVGASTTVAHKFGEHTEMLNDKVVERQLHDCGIVYGKKSPYLLCVMTKGKEFSDLEKIIGDISRMVFSFTQDPSNFK